jgi:hypothetical protein
MKVIGTYNAARMALVSRIWSQSFVHPSGQAAYLERLQSQLDAMASPEVHFEVHGLDPPDHLFHPLRELRCAMQATRNAIEAERAKQDVFVIGHFQEPGLRGTDCLGELKREDDSGDFALPPENHGADYHEGNTKACGTG